jgi:Alr-MurF fusion protein
MDYTIQEIIRILDCEAICVDEYAKVSHIVFDTRKIVQADSSIFIALHGNQHNGHQYLKTAWDIGIRNFLVEKNHDKIDLPDSNVLLVWDTLESLQKIAAYHRRKFDLDVIGITGSNGKTIVKEWLFQMLHENYNIVRSPKSYNSQLGVPLSVLGISEKDNLAIFEAGISEPGEMIKLANVIEPTIGIFTNIGEAHSSNFKDKRQKAIEKLHLFNEVKTLIYSIDQNLLHHTILDWSVGREIKRFTWGTLMEADIRIHSIIDKPGFLWVEDDMESIEINLPFSDAASIENTCYIITVMRYFGFSFKEISHKIQSLTNLPLRLELKEALNNCELIYDCYNSDLDSIQIALDFLKNLTERKKKTVILSDIPQTGRSGDSIFSELLALLKKSKVNRLIGVGKAFFKHKSIFQEYPEIDTIFFDDTASFLLSIQEMKFENEAILLKGAREFEFERIGKYLEKKVHNTVMEINLNALVNNLIVYRKHIKLCVRLMVMVKAFSYGAGVYEIAKILQLNNADYLAVAYADEGVKLRQAGINLPIMVMNPDSESLDSIIKNDLEPEIYSIDLLEQFYHVLSKQENKNKQVKFHIKIDSGMSRLGFDQNDIEDLKKHLKHYPKHQVSSIFSHLAASDEPEHDDFTKSQIRIFEDIYETVASTIGYRPLKHILNSAGIIRIPEAQFDMVRLGIGFYGIDTTNQIQDELQTVSRLKARISQIKTLNAGKSIGYNRKGFAERDMVIATISIGYADGFTRSFGNGVGSVLIQGVEVPVVGNVCMDMTMIDISEVPNAKEGDEVIIFGPELPVQKLAQKSNTIPYEILSGISERVKRIYFEE